MKYGITKTVSQSTLFLRVLKNGRLFVDLYTHSYSAVEFVDKNTSFQLGINGNT